MIAAWSDARKLVRLSSRLSDADIDEAAPIDSPLSATRSLKSARSSRGASPATTPPTITTRLVQSRHHTHNDGESKESAESNNEQLNDSSTNSILSSHHHTHNHHVHYGSVIETYTSNGANDSNDIIDDSDTVKAPQSLWSDALVMRDQLYDHPVLSSLLLCIPIGLLAGWFHFSITSIFIFNFLSIIPLAWLLGNVTEELSLRTGPIVGGLINAAMGNIVEVIVAIAALRKGMIRLVQTSLLGSILSNMLLVLGMSFLLGGLKFELQTFNAKGAKIFASMLLLACLALAVPSAYVNAFQLEANQSDILDISRVTAAIIFVVYGLYLYFQLKTHSAMFEAEHSDDDDEDEEGEGEPLLTFTGALFMLSIISVVITLCSDQLISSIEPVTRAYSINQSFVGIILLPIVGNAAEHTVAVSVAMRNKVDLSIGVAVGSSTQIALFVIPLMTLLGWIIDQPMTMAFGEFPTVLLVMSALIVTFIVKDGESNWLLGAMLIGSYAILATAFFFHPQAVNESNNLSGSLYDE